MYVLVTGCGRSGTCYISNVIQALGLDVGHENAGMNGRVDWHYAPKPKDVYKKYDTIFHQVRNPLSVISSMQITVSWKYIGKYLPETIDVPLIKKCMLYWYHWNLLVEPYEQFQYKIEEIKNPDIFNKFCRLLDVEANMEVFEEVEKRPRSFNRRNHSNLTWKMLEREDIDLTAKIKDLSIRYGYED